MVSLRTQSDPSPICLNVKIFFDYLSLVFPLCSLRFLSYRRHRRQVYYLYIYYAIIVYCTVNVRVNTLILLIYHEGVRGSMFGVQ